VIYADDERRLKGKFSLVNQRPIDEEYILRLSFLGRKCLFLVKRFRKTENVNTCQQFLHLLDVIKQIC
jgi:hypothetical protein